jgi:hypothetical protein
MAKLGGTKQGLTDLWTPFSLEEGGRVFNLSASLVFQQSLTNPTSSNAGDFTDVEKNFTSSLLAIGPYSSSMNALSFDATINPFGVAQVPGVSDTLSFAFPEMTLAMWFSGSNTSNKVSYSVQSLTSSFMLATTGTYGYQFLMGRYWQIPSDKNFRLILETVSTAGLKNVVATSDRTAGLLASQAGTSGSSGDAGTLYEGRVNEVRNYLSSSLSEDPIGLDTGWHHLAYVQRAARNPISGSFIPTFGITDSALAGSSATGEEGLCQLWIDGELRYESPAYRQWPQGFAPYFYEDGLAGLNGSTASRYQGSNNVGNRVIRHTSAATYLSGTSGADAYAQMSLWQKALAPDEIKAIYDGSRNGVFVESITSRSGAPKRLIGIDTRPDAPPDNAGFSDFSSYPSTVAFSDREALTENVSTGIYQDNEILTDGIYSGIVFTDGARKPDRSQVSSFRDTEDPTQPVVDDEFVIPDGSALVRIPVTNNDSGVAAGRFHVGDESASLSFKAITGLPATSECVGTGFLYYSPKLKKWVEKSPIGISSFSNNLGRITSAASVASMSNFISCSFGSGTPASPSKTSDYPADLNRIMSQFAWSPQFGYFVNHVEHLQQAGYSRIGWPTAVFGAPNAPKYHAWDHETIKLSDFIDRPFLLKRIELKIPVKGRRRFGVNPFYFSNSFPYGGSGGELYGPASASLSPSSAVSALNKTHNKQVTNKKDMDNYVFFLYRQRRVSRNRDTAEDFVTSKRYLIASASVCFYNSGSFGSAWQDGFFTSGSSKWQNSPGGTGQYFSGSLSASLAYTSMSYDHWGQKLTLISGSNAILHNPEYSYDWNQTRFFANLEDNSNSNEQTHATFLNLTMLPMSVPPVQVAPSLIPMTASAKVQYAFREYDKTELKVLAYINSGSRSNPASNAIAPGLTLVSNRWTGGTRPPQIAASQESDPYNTIRTKGSTDAGFSSGTVDVQALYGPTFVNRVILQTGQSVSGALSTLTYIPNPGCLQNHGISLFPTELAAIDGTVPQFNESMLTFQQPIDPAAVNAPIPASSGEGITFAGRVTNAAPAGSGTLTIEAQNYMQYYGWRFISSFQVPSQFTAVQTYNPTLLYPEDELILGLDAGTFGPPDVDVDDLPGDNNALGPLSGSTPDGSLSTLTGKRIFKDTFLKHDYRIVMTDSYLQIMSGEAELTLIGDFLQNGAPVSPTRGMQLGGDISAVYGDEPIIDRLLGFNAELLSGSLFTRVFSGSEGQEGVIAGTRRFVRDGGARR